jgi:DNA-binding NtrC family response regulator
MQAVAVANCEMLTVEAFDRILCGDRQSREPGMFEQAADGSLLLLDLDELSPVSQERLVAILEKGRYTTGTGETRLISCRLITTGNGAEIEKRIKLGQFSEELYRRLSPARVKMPPLAERRDDIPHLVVEFLHDLAQREGIEAPPVPSHYMELLMTVAWSENVRQLKNHIESVMVLSGGVFDPAIINEHFIPEGQPATIKGAFEGLLSKLRGHAPRAAWVVARK